MIVKVALRAANNSIVYQTYIGGTALVNPTSHLLEIFFNKQVIAQYKSDSYIFWEYSSLPPQLTSRANLGLDHGVGHFRPLSITRQRHLLAYHGIAMSCEGLCQVF